jgi:hypothetical protein
MTRRLWRQNGTWPKVGSIALVVAGMLGLLVLSYLLLYLIPVIILAAFVGAVTENARSGRR